MTLQAPALGEAVFAAEVAAGRFSYPEIGIAVLGRLFEERLPAPGEIGSLSAWVAKIARTECDLVPVLGAMEDAWFSAGMHVSPFAVSDGQPDEPGEGG